MPGQSRVEEWLFAIGGLQDSFKHFLFSGVAGLLAYCLTWIMCWFSYSKGSPSRGRTFARIQADRSISRLCWSAAVFFAFLVHCVQDGLIR